MGPGTWVSGRLATRSSQYPLRNLTHHGIAVEAGGEEGSLYFESFEGGECHHRPAPNLGLSVAGGVKQRSQGGLVSD